METQNQVQEVKEQQNGKFAIDLLPIENKEDKFSYMTNLSIIRRDTSNTVLHKL